MRRRHETNARTPAVRADRLCTGCSASVERTTGGVVDAVARDRAVIEWFEKHDPDVMRHLAGAPNGLVNTDAPAWACGATWAVLHRSRPHQRPTNAASWDHLRGLVPMPRGTED